MIRINLIAGPRNISTALMYSFAQRGDTAVIDEPFYAFYLHTTGISHPGRDEILASQPNNERNVSQSILDNQDKPVLFIKNMAHHVELIEQTFLEEVVNIFLIRNPAQILASYAQVIDDVNLRDIGIEYQFTLFHRLQAQGKRPIIIDAAFVLENPPSVLQQVCERIGIPFSTKMLRWLPGPKPYDGVWARHWYANVHKSTGFEKQPTSNRPLPQRLRKLNDVAQYYYQAIAPFSVRPE